MRPLRYNLEGVHPLGANESPMHHVVMSAGPHAYEWKIRDLGCTMDFMDVCHRVHSFDRSMCDLLCIRICNIITCSLLRFPTRVKQKVCTLAHFWNTRLSQGHICQISDIYLHTTQYTLH